MGLKKIVLMITLFFMIQSASATTYICRADASLTERKFFEICFSCHAKSLREFLDQQKHLLSEEDFKKLINMTAENDRTMFTLLINKAFVEKEKALDALAVLASYKPDLYVGSLLPLDVLINTYLLYSIFAQETEKYALGVVGVLGIIEEIPYCVHVSLFILDLLKDLKQNFNYKNKDEQPALHKLVESRLRRQEITKSDLVLINKLLQLGADPTLEIDTLIEHENAAAVDLAYSCSDDAKYKNADKLYELFNKYGYEASYPTWIESNCVIA